MQKRPSFRSPKPSCACFCALPSYPHAQRCPLDESVFYAAAEAGHGAALEWLAGPPAARCPTCPIPPPGRPRDGSPAYVRALRQSPGGPDWITLEALRRLGCPMGSGAWRGAAPARVVPALLSLCSSAVARAMVLPLAAETQTVP